MAKRGYKTMEEAEKAKKDKNELRKGKKRLKLSLIHILRREQ